MNYTCIRVNIKRKIKKNFHQNNSNVNRKSALRKALSLTLHNIGYYTTLVTVIRKQLTISLHIN